MPLLYALLLAAPPQEDAAHRADRLRTEALNRGVIGQSASIARTNAAARARYEAARAAYQRDMDAWRRRSDACVDGDYAAC